MVKRQGGVVLLMPTGITILATQLLDVSNVAARIELTQEALISGLEYPCEKDLMVHFSCLLRSLINDILCLI